MMNIAQNITTNWQEALSLIEAPVLAFDVETDTHDYHWESGDRGLAYPADMTHLAIHAGPDYPTLVLVAQATEVEYEVEELVYNEFQEPQWVTTTHQKPTIKKCLKAQWVDLGSPSEGRIDIDEQTSWSAGDYKFGFISHQDCYKKFVYRFSDEEVGFIRALLGKDRPASVTLVAHNLVFDARQVFGKFGLPVVNPSITFWDTLPIEMLGLFGDPDDNMLLDVYQRYAELTKRNLDWLQSMKQMRNKLHTLPEDEVLVYVAWDAIAAYRIYEGQQAQEKYKGFDKLLQEELDYTRWCVHIAVKGIRLDVDYARKRLVETIIPDYLGSLGDLGLRREQVDLPRKNGWLEEYIFTKAGVPRPTAEDIADEPKLLTKGNLALFESNTLDLTEAGIWSFGKDAMKWYLGDYDAKDYDTENCPYPELLPLVRFKKMETVKDTVEEFLRHAEFDGLIHSILTRRTITGRNSSSSPNIQNIDFKQHPGLLIARPGCVLIELDYSNAENYAMGGNGKDSRMILACLQEDFHSAMARAYFGEENWRKATKEQRKDMRRKGKTITFGTAYGMGVTKLARQLRISIEDAKAMLANKDRSFPDMAEAKEWTKDFSEQYGYIALWSGRRIPIRKKFNPKNRRYEFKGYTGWNGRAQGGVGELVTRAINRMWRFVRENEHGSDVLAMIHDSIIVELKVEEYSIVQQLIEIMSTAMPEKYNQQTTPPVRWLVDLDNASNAKKWGYVHGQDYPLPLEEYVNRWGYHKLPEGAAECPIWINQWGWGEQAVLKEAETFGYAIPKSVDQLLAAQKAEEDQGAPEQFATQPSFKWTVLKIELERALELAAPGSSQITSLPSPKLCSFWKAYLKKAITRSI